MHVRLQRLHDFYAFDQHVLNILSHLESSKKIIHRKAFRIQDKG
jgi:hypothetical protein